METEGATERDNSTLTDSEKPRESERGQEKERDRSKRQMLVSHVSHAVHHSAAIIVVLRAQLFECCIYQSLVVCLNCLVFSIPLVSTVPLSPSRPPSLLALIPMYEI